MKLDRINIKNFKGLRDVELEPSTFSCLVGENNAGKSSVLQAVSTALLRPPQIPRAQYYDPTLPVEFRLEFSEVSARDLARLTPEQQGKIAGCLDRARLTIIVRYPLGQKMTITTERRVPIDERFRAENIDEAFKGRRAAAAIRAALAETFPELEAGIADPLTVPQVKAYLASQMELLPADQWTSAEGPLPTGASASIVNLLPEAIYIPAVRDLKDELKTSQSTSFGRLLGLLLEDMTPELGAITDSFQTLDRLLNRARGADSTDDHRHEKVRSLEGRVEGFLQEHFADASVELSIPQPELKTILNNAQIFVDDGSRDLVENKGDGIKRSLTFALLRSYVELLAERSVIEPVAATEHQPSPRPLIFLFEEPELYLHPRSQRVLFDALATISKSHQVVVTTHSPLFFAPGVTASFVRVAKEPETPKPIGRLYPIDFGLGTDHAKTFRLARFENADAAFFSQSVVLIEGESDDAFFKHVAAKLNPAWDFDKANIALVRVSGKGNFSLFRSFFECFGLKVVVIADLDAMFKDFQHLGAPAAATPGRLAAIDLVDRRIDLLGIRAEPSTSQIKDKMRQGSWRQRYDDAKAIVRVIQRGGVPSPEQVSTLDALFTWEADVARVNACVADDEARQALTPTLDALRAAGVIVLSRGAVEAYYPTGVPTTCAKPARALAACDLIETRDDAFALSSPLDAGRQPELVEILESIFGP